MVCSFIEPFSKQTGEARCMKYTGSRKGKGSKAKGVVS